MTIYVGQNIRSLRIRRQISQEDLAASVGVTVHGSVIIGLN
jgi:transcriptional regulator with XRE-family HTH domain